MTFNQILLYFGVLVIFVFGIILGHWAAMYSVKKGPYDGTLIVGKKAAHLNLNDTIENIENRSFIVLEVKVTDSDDILYEGDYTDGESNGVV